MIDIVITADYEIFGNGTGDVRQCLTDPTDELLTLCGRYGVKMTIFFEIAEYWAFQAAEEKGLLTHGGYSPSGLMRRQATEAVLAGHDVQLHIHPQWLGSEYGSNGWQVNLAYWCLPDVPHGLGDFDDILSLRGLLRKGKLDLESMLRPFDPAYECIGLRAGGWCIQPAGEVLQAMREVGLRADSSVFPGGYSQQFPYNIDYRDAHSECIPWRVHPEDINRAIKTGTADSIWELPIFTRQQNRIARLNLSRLGRLLKRRLVRHEGGHECEQSHVTGALQRSSSLSAPREFLRYYFLDPAVTMWDYCHQSAGEMWGFLQYFLQKYYSDDSYFPLVMIGHPKSFADPRNLEGFLERVASCPLYADGRLRFATFRDAVKTLTASDDG